MAKPTKRPTKHKIETGGSDKVSRVGAPRKAVKKVPLDSADVDDFIDDEIEDGGFDEGDETTAGDATPTRKSGIKKVDVSSGKKSDKPVSKHTSKRVTAKGTPAASTRYTPPAVRYEDMPSPIWVPILMFSLFVLGMLSIFLNYVALLPGGTSNWYLLLGLGFILSGIITATQYR